MSRNRDRSASTGRNASAPSPRTTPQQGILAGRIIDRYDRRVDGATVKIVSASDPLNGEVAPIDYERTTNARGEFALANLEVGKVYQIIAKVRMGDRIYSGAAFARPPDPVILVRLTKEEFSSPNVPSSPVIIPETEPIRERRPEPETAIRTPRATEDSENRGLPGLPSPPNSDTTPVVPGRPKLDRTIVIPPALERKPTRVPRLKIPIPSCQRLGSSVRSFALRDLNNNPWVYPRDRQGKLVLLDFWRTGCIPCLRASPALGQLQKEFRTKGLEVIGIACESTTSPRRERAVTQLLARHPMHYRVLMSGYRSPNEPCPVQVQLGVNRFPTLILLDENGTIVWRSEGLTSQRLAELRHEIQKRLR